MKLVAACRQKNGLTYLPRLIPQLRSIADIVVFLDDYSTDGSYEQLVAQAKLVPDFYVIRQPEKTFNGGRDWNVLYDFVKQFQPDWLFCPDVDELIEESSADRVRQLAEQSGQDVLGWSFPFYYLWNDEKHYRNDGMYKNTRVIRLYRYSANYKPPMRATHSTATPDEVDRRLIRIADARMWHFGYMLESDRAAKYNFYTTRDKDPKAVGAGSTNYDHMIQTPNYLVQVRDLKEWKDPTKPRKLGDFLDHAPVRVSIGAFYPAAYECDITELERMSNDSVDELRISFLLDSASILESSAWLSRAKEVLRPGGRLEVIAIDYEAVCRAFAEGDNEKKAELLPRLMSTPHRKPFKTLFFESRLHALIESVGFTDVQRITVTQLPFRLTMLGYKSGSDKWV